MHIRCTAFCEIAEGFFIDIQSLRYTPIFQILSYLGHQLYTYWDRCYIEGEFVDIV